MLNWRGLTATIKSKGNQVSLFLSVSVSIDVEGCLGGYFNPIWHWVFNPKKPNNHLRLRFLEPNGNEIALSCWQRSLTLR